MFDAASEPSLDRTPADADGGLTPAQVEAVEHDDGPLLVLAGAGSGKTRVVTRRIARLIRDGVPPWSILAITFTNRAAEEMRARVARLLGQDAGERGGAAGGMEPSGGGGSEAPHVPVWLSTFHSFGARWLRRLGEGTDLHGRDRRFVIYDRDDSSAVVREIVKDMALSTDAFKPGPILDRISRWKEEFCPPETALETAMGQRDRAVARIYGAYEGLLRRRNAFDFDDLLTVLCRILEDDEAALRGVRERFRHLLVDEYQDTNPPQHRLCRLIAGEHRNVCVVGDPDQSIYGWRGADITNILSFEEAFPRTTVCRLERNWRSTGKILGAAQGLIRNNVERREKTLWTDNPDGEPVAVRILRDEMEEARWVASEVQSALDGGVPASEIAVFFRTNAASRALEQALVDRSIPYRVVGTVAFFERREVKDALAYLRLVANPRDDLSFLRVVNVPTRGVGKKTVERLRAFADERSIPLLEAARRVEEIETLRTRAENAVGRFLEVIDAIRDVREGGSVAEVVGAVLRESGLRASWEDSDDPSAPGRLENLAQLHRAAEEHDQVGRVEGLQGFLEQIALVTRFFDEDGDAVDRVSLMTVHSAKGLEFDRVHVIGLEEGLFPHSRAVDEGNLEEERRLLYVAMTRARERLILTAARSRSLYGNRGGFERARMPSSFLREIPEEVVDDASRSALGLPPEGPFRSPVDDDGERRSVFKPPSGPQTTRERVESPSGGPTDLEEGDRVRHPEWGEGTVAGLVGSGFRRKVVVDFASGERRELILHYANLSRVS